MNIKIYFDGACNNHAKTKPMGIGVAVYISGEYDEELSLAIGLNEGWNKDESTSNIAEWIGCVEAMRAAKGLKKEYKHARIRVYSDSQVITNQFNGVYSVRAEQFKKYKQKAKEFWGSNGIGDIIWIPRERNQQADLLSKQGLKLAS